MGELHALFIHGVGEQSADFASDARHNLRAALAEQGTTLYAASVHWAPLADKHEHKFMRAVERKGSKGNMLQRLVVGTLADAIAYQANEQLRQQIMSAVDWQYARLRAGGVHIFAHSLGGLVAVDWLRSRTNARPSRLHTFGCNIGLFNLGRQFDCPRSVLNDGRWVNYFDKHDMLGFPLKTAPEFAHVRDVEVSVGGWFTGWTGLAHTAYFGDRKFWSRVVPRYL